MASRRGLLTALAALVAALLPAPIATDGDFDVFVGLDDGTIKYMLNGGTRSFMTLTEQTTAATHPLYGEDVGAEAMLSCVDIDADLPDDSIKLLTSTSTHCRCPECTRREPGGKKLRIVN